MPANSAFLVDQPGPWTTFAGGDTKMIGKGPFAYHYRGTWYPQAGWWLALVAVILCGVALAVCMSSLR